MLMLNRYIHVYIHNMCYRQLAFFDRTPNRIAQHTVLLCEPISCTPFLYPM